MKKKWNQLLALILLGALFMTNLGASAYAQNNVGTAGMPEENHTQPSVSGPNTSEKASEPQGAAYTNLPYATVSAGQIMAAPAENAGGAAPLADSEGIFQEKDGAIYYYQPLGLSITTGPNTTWYPELEYKLDSATQTATLMGVKVQQGDKFSSFQGNEELIAVPAITYKDTQYTVTTVGENAFRDQRTIKSIKIPDTIIRIEPYAFDHCEQIEEFEIPANVNYIGNAAFNNCLNLSKINIPDGITTIPDAAFQGCQALNLNDVHIPDSVTTIGNSAFDSAGFKTDTPADLVIPNNVTSIGKFAFYMANIRSITFPAERKEVLILDDSYNCFVSCQNLKIVTVLSDKVHIMNGEFRGCASDAITYFPSYQYQPTRVPTRIHYSVNADGKTVTIDYVENNKLAQTPAKIGDWYVSAVTNFYAEYGKHVCYFGENDSLFHCTICAHENGNHTHTWNTEYTIDVEATCTREGQKSRHCQTCDQATDITAIPLVPHTLTHHERVESTCTETGTLEYWNCSVCRRNYSDENGTKRLYVITISAKGHITAHYEKVAPTCTDPGAVEHWHCSGCAKDFSDEAGTTELTDIVLPATGHTMVHHEKTEPACTADGVAEYWHCSVCAKDFSDEAGTAELTDLVLPATGHTMAHHEKMEPTCTADGATAHWHCSLCGKNFSDEDGQQELTDITIPASGHTMTHHEKMEPTCTADGVAEYWHCSVCDKNFSDQAGTTELTDPVLPATGHNLIHHEKMEPTCTADGVAEYWHCSVCDKNFSDQNGTEEMTDLTLPMTGHTYGTTWKTDENKHWHTCACGATADEASHTFRWITAQEGTDSQPGSMYEACTVCGYQKAAAQELPEHPQDTALIQFKMILTQEIREIPQSLRDKGLENSEKIETALKVEIAKKDTSHSNTALYDVTLLVRRQGSSQWEKADASNFPSNGRLQVILPYPEGTGRDTHDFLVAHMFTTDDFGKTPGQVEMPVITKTAEGLQFDVTGLSPILLSWKAVSAPLPDESSSSDDQNNSPDETRPSDNKPSSDQTRPSDDKPSSGQTGPSDDKPSSGQTGPSDNKPSSGQTRPSGGTSSSGNNNTSGGSHTSDNNHSSDNRNPSIANNPSADSAQNAGSGPANQPVPVQSIATGDDYHSEIWVLLLILSFGGIGVILKKRMVR